MKYIPYGVKRLVSITRGWTRREAGRGSAYMVVDTDILVTQAVVGVDSDSISDSRDESWGPVDGWTSDVRRARCKMCYDATLARLTARCR